LEQLTAKAETYCAAVEHCIWEVRNKLQQWEATAEQIEQILIHLQQHKFIDEKRYCSAYVHDKLLYQGWGRMKIRAQLLIKHLPSAFIEQALAEIDEQTYQEVLRKIITTKKRSIKSSDPQIREKLIRFCMQRGFTYEEIKKTVD
jgi:regulatory protein